MFSLFLDEIFSTKELLFFLFARSVVEKIVGKKSKKAVTLTSTQQTECLHNIFATQTQVIERIQNSLATSITVSYFLLTLTMTYLTSILGFEPCLSVPARETTQKDEEMSGVVKRLQEIV